MRELVRTGKDELFNELVGRFKDKVFRLAASILGPGRETEAEDVTQEVFLVVYRKLRTFRHDSEFSTWLYRLTRNRAIDSLRKARFRHQHVGDGELRLMPTTAPSSNPEAVAAAGERRSEVLRHVQRLSDRQRSVILLHYWMGSAVSEIAELLDMNEQTVKSHLHLGETLPRAKPEIREQTMNEPQHDRIDRALREAFAAAARPAPSPFFDSKLRAALVEERRRRRAVRARMRIMQLYWALAGLGMPRHRGRILRSTASTHAWHTAPGGDGGPRPPRRPGPASISSSSSSTPQNDFEVDSQETTPANAGIQRVPPISSAPFVLAQQSHQVV